MKAWFAILGIPQAAKRKRKKRAYHCVLVLRGSDLAAHRATVRNALGPDARGGGGRGCVLDLRFLAAEVLLAAAIAAPVGAIDQREGCSHFCDGGGCGGRWSRFASASPALTRRRSLSLGRRRYSPALVPSSWFRRFWTPGVTASRGSAFSRDR